MRVTITGPSRSDVARLEQTLRRRMEAAALAASDRGGRIAFDKTRAAMAGAGLGRLGNAIGRTSDLAKGRGVYRQSDRFSASGVVYVKGKSERTAGAIEAYTQGANITPRRGGWLWIASADLQKRVKGGFRMTPAQYRAKGFEAKIGPLVSITGRNTSERLLIVRNITVSTDGRANPRSLPKTGRVRAGRQQVEQFVAFIGIRSTSRQARVNPIAIAQEVQRQLPGLIGDELDKNRSL